MAAYVVCCAGVDEGHAGFLGDAAGGYVGYGFCGAENGLLQGIEPVVVDGDYGFRHEALILPGLG